ncbi:MAG: hypothetical protein Q8920_11215 [Bacillota bacterium]|nr:hypothetical protein [Bacillota bacterium]
MLRIAIYTERMLPFGVQMRFLEILKLRRIWSLEEVYSGEGNSDKNKGSVTINC